MIRVRDAQSAAALRAVARVQDDRCVTARASGLAFESRGSDLPWIASVWTARSEQVTEMTAIASETWGLVVWSQDDEPHAAVVGPETRASTAPVPQDATFIGNYPLTG